MVTMKEMNQKVKGKRAKVYNYKPSGERFFEGIATIDKIVGPYPTQYESYFPTRYLCHYDDDPALLVERNIWEKDIES